MAQVIAPMITVKRVAFESTRPCVECGAPASAIVDDGKDKFALCANHASAKVQKEIDRVNSLTIEKSK